MEAVRHKQRLLLHNNDVRETATTLHPEYFSTDQNVEKMLQMREVYFRKMANLENCETNKHRQFFSCDSEELFYTYLWNFQ